MAKTVLDIPAPDSNIRARLAGFVEEDLMGAHVRCVNAYVDADGNIEIDELIIKTHDGRELSIGHPPRSKITIDIYDPKKEKWRPMTIAEDYSEEFEELTAPQWHAGDDIDRPEDRI